MRWKMVVLLRDLQWFYLCLDPLQQFLIQNDERTWNFHRQVHPCHHHHRHLYRNVHLQLDRYVLHHFRLLLNYINLDRKRLMQLNHHPVHLDHHKFLLQEIHQFEQIISYNYHDYHSKIAHLGVQLLVTLLDLMLILIQAKTERNRSSHLSGDW